jgi:hypothetical protein
MLQARSLRSRAGKKSDDLTTAIVLAGTSFSPHCGNRVCQFGKSPAGRTRTSNQTVIARDTSEPGLASLLYRRSGRGSTRCSVFLRADRSFRPFRAFS